eukprot:CAMPEP_0206606470 /NCGR_PEP_ID=MMETSP0325_2-20121206/51350_1 /ASSEMBLY_ACC=CAM_ASM_000347 /TAXON_ID=2866 /ORGANISM="Crypthecodinium cohnii, Strain Seligo" /LENGTH=84 /DNA_ID=CAMNT_0054122851 /DNA_START=477 /DNA_END=727 /DNA_ORIENTATION=+
MPPRFGVEGCSGVRAPLGGVTAPLMPRGLCPDVKECGVPGTGGSSKAPARDTRAGVDRLPLDRGGPGPWMAAGEAAPVGPPSAG